MIFVIFKPALQRRVSFRDSLNFTKWVTHRATKPLHERDQLGVKSLNLKSVVGTVEVVLVWRNDLKHHNVICELSLYCPKNLRPQRARTQT